MSVLIAGKMTGDVEAFRKALAERADEFTAHADRARGAGALHHRFGIADGYVLIIDEWESAEQFETFFTDPQLQAFIASAGGDTSAPPEITVAEAIDSPDQF
jgi:quinol monooxygenase YgiN